MKLFNFAYFNLFAGLFLVLLHLVYPVSIHAALDKVISQRDGDWQRLTNVWLYDANDSWYWVAGTDSWMWVFGSPMEGNEDVNSAANWQWLSNVWLHDSGNNWYWLSGSNVWVWVYDSNQGGTPPSGMVFVEGGTLVTTNGLGGTELASFYIGRYEVTWGEWKTVRAWASANGYDIGLIGSGCADDHPVHSVNWYDVLKWSNAKSEMEGLTPVYTVNGEVYRVGELGGLNENWVFVETAVVDQNLSANGYRLPMEVEWEFAARGGNLSNGFTYAGSNNLDESGWHSQNSAGAACNLSEGRGTWPVGLKVPNELGIYDMSGNVWEWCWDRLDESNPRRIVRGGSWRFAADSWSVEYRYFNPFTPDFRFDSYGFRLARSSGVN